MLRKLIKIIKRQDFAGALGNRSISDDGSYLIAVKLALKEHRYFKRFKRDPRYTAILEHTSESQGVDYLNIIKSQSPLLLNKFNDFKENDLIGGSTTFNYEGVGMISPSTLRYIKVVSDLENLFGTEIGDRVAEIGVGYGGQLLVADKALKFKQYDLFDLKPVLLLASQYIESHILNSSYSLKTINQHIGDVEYDLVISNYAFSELPSKLQIKYIEKVLSKAKRGYLTMNSGKSNSAFLHDKLSITDLERLLPKFELLPEQPLSHPGNYIITWNQI